MFRRKRPRPVPPEVSTPRLIVLLCHREAAVEWHDTLLDIWTLDEVGQEVS